MNGIGASAAPTELHAAAVRADRTAPPRRRARTRSPAPAAALDPSFETCGTAETDGGAGPFASLDPGFVCSGLVAAGARSARVHGLENGRAYQIAVVAVGVDGTPSAPSAAAEGTPAPTVGFQEL